MINTRTSPQNQNLVLGGGSCIYTDVGRGVQKIVAYSHSYLAGSISGPSCINSFWHGVIDIPIFNNTCVTHF